MSTGYQIENPKALYYLTMTIVDWVDVFSRERYCTIIIDSLKYCRKEKGLKVFAFVIMTNHLHLIVQAEEGNLSDVIRDFKRHTAREILKAVKQKGESRSNWILRCFEKSALSDKQNLKHQVWQHKNHAIELESAKFINQKMAYIHENPIRSGLVDDVNAWRYSSQRNYAELDTVMEIDYLSSR